MELFGVMVGTSVVAWVVILGVATLLFPLFWLWMFVDALLRDQRDYPGGDSTEKIVWVLLLLVAAWAAIVYFAAVYARRRGGEAPPIALTRAA